MCVWGGGEGRFADFISFLLKISHENDFIFIGYFKTGGGGGEFKLTPRLIKSNEI